MHSVLTTSTNLSLNVPVILSGTFPITNSIAKHAILIPFSIAKYFKLISSPSIQAFTPLTISLIPSLIKKLANLKIFGFAEYANKAAPAQNSKTPKAIITIFPI